MRNVAETRILEADTVCFDIADKNFNRRNLYITRNVWFCCEEHDGL